MQNLFKVDKREETSDAPVNHHQHPPVVWQSATVADRRDSGFSTEDQVQQVAIRSKVAGPVEFSI